MWRPLAWLAAAAAMLLGGVAQAGPGDHIRAGAVEITPGLDAGLEYSSNVFRSDVGPEGGLDFLLEPTLGMSAKGDDHEFDLTGFWQLRKYFKRSQKSLDRFSDFGIGAKVHLFKQSRIGLRIEDTMGRNNRPVDRSNAQTAFNPQYRNDLAITAPIAITPVLRLDVGGDWLFHRVFTPNYGGAGTVEFNHRNNIGPRGELVWQFLPRTEVYVAGGYAWNDWAENWVDNQVPQPNSQFWRATLGLRGRFTGKLIVLAEAGYGQATYNEASVDAAGGNGALATDDVRGLTGLLLSASIGWQTGPREKIGVSYKRDFEDSFFTNYVAYDQGLLFADLRFGTRIGFHVGGKLRSERYHGYVNRNDVLLGADTSVTYWFTEWLSTTADFSYGQRLSAAPGVPFMELQGGLKLSFVY